MPTLNWIGKEAVINHHQEVPFHLLTCDNKLSIGDSGSGNLLVQGDNLVALKALLPHYAGKVKCIYIDPPYNTGNEGWVYNDNVNSPEIKDWLGKVVGKEAEDLSRHDKWLCMMYPRLKLLKDFLHEDGTIWICIDDNEGFNLKLLCDEIFGVGNFITSIAWRAADSSNNDAKQFSMDHNLILVYSRNSNWLSNSLPRTAESNAHYSNPDNDPKGAWFMGNVSSPHPRDNLRYDMPTPSGKTIKPPHNGWRWNLEKAKEKISTGQIVFVDNDTRLVHKTYLADQKGLSPSSIWDNIKYTGHNRQAKYELKKLFPGVQTTDLFSTPKPERLAQYVLMIASNEGDIVLDSFAGSGTTGAVALKMKRKSIMIEMGEHAQTHIIPRLRKVVSGEDQGGISKEVEWKGGGGIRFCKLGKTLFDEYGNINSEVKFNELAAHVYFCETGEPLPKRTNGKTPLLGIHNGTAIYLLYNGILGDKAPNGGNVLTRDVLNGLPNHDGAKIIFGTSCRLGDARLQQENIIFKQVPYEVKEK